MAYRSKGRRRGSVRRSRSGGYRSKRAVSRSRTSGGRGGSRRAAGGRAQTVRIVLEQPAQNPMMQVPVGQAVKPPPRKAQF